MLHIIGFTVSLSAPSSTPFSSPHACHSSTFSFSEHRPEALFHRIAATIETIGVQGIARFVHGVVDTRAEAMCVPARSDQGVFHTACVRFTGMPLSGVGLIIFV